MVKELACRNCKCINTGKVCQACSSADLSADWNGMVIVVDPENSQIAKTLGITKNGKYALRVA
jgi:DNA-directed RNA polymerase subunit E"